MRNGGLGCLVFFFFLLALSVAMVITCPKEADHYEALQEVVGQVIDERIGQVIDERIGQSDSAVGEIWKTIGKLALGKTGGIAITQMVRVDDYYLFSLGRLSFGGKERIVSVGVLGHVITPTKEQLQQEMQKHGL